MIYIIEIDCICLFALIFVLGNMHRKKSLMAASKYLYYAGYFTMLVIVMDILSLLLENQKLGPLNKSIFFNYVINNIFYVGSVTASYLWFMNVEYTIDSHFWSKLKHRLIAQIPGYLCVVITVINFFNGMYFFIDQNNKYHRGPLFYINNIICFAYASFCCTHAFYASFKEGDYVKKKQYRLLAGYIFFPILFSLIQTFNPEIPTILIGMTVPIIYIYTELLDLQISTDYLTGLNNRTQLMRYLESMTANPSKDKHLYLFLMDVDSFKKINDNYGHAEGDFALQRTAEILKGAASRFGGFVARYGGDEFTYAVELEDEKTVNEIRAYFEKESEEASKTLEYSLGLSVGYARHSPGLKVSELFLLADSDMYNEKSIRKKLRGV